MALAINKNVFITCAVTGSGSSQDKSREVPRSPKEIADSAIDAAKAAGADALITADLKYHQFYQAEGQIVLADIGHYESEQYTKNILTDFLTKKFTNFAVVLSDENTNPIKYL